jgi:PAS domain S-box-containing protein
MNIFRICGCSTEPSANTSREPTDPRIEPAAGEIESLRQLLLVIEELLSRLFGRKIYSRDEESLRIRALAADLIDRHFDGIVDQWTQAVLTIFGDRQRSQEGAARLREDLSNALIRLIAHMRSPDDLTTYVYLRKHCETGMLARAKPSEFNTVHIALKQVILPHVRSALDGPEMEAVRDAVVAAIDERRLMVSQFYMASREQQLRESEEKYRNSVDHAPDPMYEIEPFTWRILSANSAAKALHAAMPGEEQLVLEGRPITDLVPAEMRPYVTASMEMLLRHGSEQAADVPIGPRFFDINSAVITYGSKQFIQMILHDVTHRREMLESLLRAERLAATGTFAAGVAHEVNNPLASISSLVQSLLGGEQDQQRRTTLHTILAQITRISGTLKDLVNFARPATSQQRVVDINRMVAETLRVITFDKRFRGIKLEPVLDPDLGAAFADDNEIQQVILNLLYNAADATSAESGVIQIVTSNMPCPEGDCAPQIMVQIIDNGIGIPRENLERVFDPFFTTKPAGAGVGLGLSLCQRIILANKGTIRVDSEVGRGTGVTILLPAHEAVASAGAGAATA